MELVRPRQGREPWILKGRAPKNTPRQNAFTIGDEGAIIMVERDIRQQKALQGKPLPLNNGGVKASLREQKERQE